MTTARMNTFHPGDAVLSENANPKIGIVLGYEVLDNNPPLTTVIVAWDDMTTYETPANLTLDFCPHHQLKGTP